MKISTKGRYAVRMMLDLAANDAGEPIRLKDIARRQNISEKYLEQIISVLNKAGFVRSIRGPQGGYTLSREPREYTVGSILKLTEGSLNAVSCTSQGAAACSRTECCETKPMWDRLDRMIDDFFEGITLEDLLNDNNP